MTTDTFKLLGIEPSSEGGRYFADSKWWWHALWDYVYSVCGDILTEEDYISGHRVENDYIISVEETRRIAERLMDLVESGECERYEESYMESLRALPETPPEGKDISVHDALMYPFTTENVKEFADFCYHSGGFVISTEDEHSDSRTGDNIVDEETDDDLFEE